MTQSENDCGLTMSDLENASQETRDKVLLGIAKTKAYDLISSQRIMNRTSRYLDQKQRAIRKMQGLDMGKGTDEEEKVVLGDNDESITNHHHQALLSNGAAAVLTALIAAAGAVGWKMVDSNSPNPTGQPPPAGFSADVVPGFGTPEPYTPNTPQ
jgi:hypothetical protein